MFVSVICPTYKRHRFIPFLIEQFNRQVYDKELMELIILDDTPTPFPFQILDKRIRYVHDNSKHYELWEKRNMLNALTKGNIIVCMDDDDYSFPHRIQKSVEVLKTQNKPLTGCSSLYIYDIHNKKLHLMKSSNSKILLNGTFAYTRALLEKTKYTKTLQNNFEEKTFTKNFSVPFAHMKYTDTIVCVSHNKNTVDKSRFLKQNTVISKPSFEFDLSLLFDSMPMLYWINMSSSKNRFDHMMSQLNQFPFHRRIEGVTEPNIQYNNKRYKKEQMGCLCSHMAAMRTSLEDETRSYAVICEDDIQLKNMCNFHEIMFYYVKTAPVDWTVLQLFSIKESKQVISRKEASNEILLKWVPWNKRYYSTMIYVIKKSHIRVLMERFERISSKSTGLLADEFIYTHGKTYSLSVPYFEDTPNFESLIDASHKTFHDSNNNHIRANLSIVEMNYPFDKIYSI